MNGKNVLFVIGGFFAGVGSALAYVKREYVKKEVNEAIEKLKEKLPLNKKEEVAE